MEQEKASLAKRALPAALLTVFIDAIGVGILIPIYTLLVAPGPQRVIPAGWSRSSGFIMLGWLAGSYALATFVAAPILGQLSDRHGRKKVLAFSLFGTAISYVMFAIGILSKNIPLLFASRILDGLTGGNIAVARAVVSDVSTPKTRTKNFGLMGAMFGFGFVIGPYLGGKLALPHIPFINLFGLHLFNTPAWFNASVPFWFAAIIAYFNSILAFFVLPETLKEKIHGHFNATKAFTNIKKAFKMPGLNRVFPTTFLWNGGFAFFNTFFGLNLISRIPGFTPSNVADFFSFIGICIIITQVVVTPFLAKRFSNYQVIRYSLFGMSAAMLVLFLPHSSVALYSSAWLVPLFIGITMANMIALVSSVAPPQIQGEVMGINSSVEALAQGIPQVMSGYIASIGLGVPIYVASATIALGGIIFWILFRPKYIISHQHEPVSAH